MPCLLLDQFYHDYVNESRRSLFFGGAGGILRKFTNFAMPLLKEGAFGTPTPSPNRFQTLWPHEGLGQLLNLLLASASKLEVRIGKNSSTIIYNHVFFEVISCGLLKMSRNSQDFCSFTSKEPQGAKASLPVLWEGGGKHQSHSALTGWRWRSDLWVHYWAFMKPLWLQFQTCKPCVNVRVTNLGTPRSSLIFADSVNLQQCPTR